MREVVDVFGGEGAILGSEINIVKKQELIGGDKNIILLPEEESDFGPTTHLDFARLKRLNYLSPLLPVCLLYTLRSAQTVNVS